MIYANSILGAKTQKHPDYFDLFVAMTGRAPKAGVYLSEKRMPKYEIGCVLGSNSGNRYMQSIGDKIPIKIDDAR